MLTLFGNLDSGNVHKVQMLLVRRGLGFRRVDVAQPRGEPRRSEFLRLNPIGKVPALLLADGDVLSESGAILYYFAVGTPLWPEATRAQAEVLRWMFFEQYSHEPTLAVLRYLRRFSPDPAGNAARIAELEPRARQALDAMEARLAAADWLAGAAATIADYALYPYTRMAGESGLALDDRPAVGAWLARVETLPGFLPVYADGAEETLDFEAFFVR